MVGGVIKRDQTVNELTVPLNGVVGHDNAGSNTKIRGGLTGNRPFIPVRADRTLTRS